MFSKEMGIRLLVPVCAALLVAAGARAGGELTPEQRRALEKEAAKLNAQGLAMVREGKLKEAREPWEKALAMRRRLYPEGHPDLATSLNNLGVLLQVARGDLGGAERHLADALAMRRRLYPEGHLDLATSLNNLGKLLQAQGDLGGAERHLADALAMLRQLYPKDHSDLAGSLNNLGSLLQARGDLGGAEKHYAEALAMYRRLYPEDHPDLAGSLNNLGSLLNARGDLGGAERHYAEALAMYRRLYPKGHHYLLAISLNNLGTLLQARGDLGGAEKYLTEALAMRRQLYPKGHPALALNLNNLGLLLLARGNLGGAERHLTEALAMRRQLYPKDHPALAQSLNSLGACLQARGDLGGAEKQYADALAMRRRLYPEDHPELANNLNNLGSLLQARGDLPGAEKHYAEALAMYRRLYPRDNPHLANSLNHLGSLLWARGNLGAAEKHCAEALAMQQRFLFKEAGVLAEADALNLAATFGMNRDAFLSITRSRPGDAAAYDLVWQGRSALTRLVEQRHRDLLASKDPNTRKLGVKLLSARQRLSHILLAPVQESAKHSAEVQKLTEDKEGLEREVAQKLRLELPPGNQTPPPPSRLAAVLPAGAAFLDFYRYTHFEYDPNVIEIKGERRTPHYVAFVLGKVRTAVRVELGEAAPLEKAWAAWHEAIVNDAPTAKECKAAAALAKLIWEPIREKLPSGVHTLYLAPDGVLTQVPWSALPGEKPGTVLLEQYSFATVPHGPFLLARLVEKVAPFTKKGILLAVGGVDYQKATAPAQVADASDATIPSKKRVVWPPLPATGRESERVAALAEKHSGLMAQRLSGGDATTDEVLYALPRARFAHLATHGFFADAQFLSAFQADPKQFGRLTRDRQGGAKSPLVLSGLVFAGANRTGDEAEDDRGILTAEALVGLRLVKLELAVLSACNTGLGEVGGGEGVYGLQRAFHVAGCKNVIASLWSVDDQSTAALMALFYRNLWEQKMDPMQALRQAQLELYRHPEQVKLIARRGPDFTPVPLPKVSPNQPGPQALTAQWAAFTFSGVAVPPRAGK